MASQPITVATPRAANSGYSKGSMKTFKNEIDALLSIDADYIVGPTGSCVFMIKEYPEILADDPVYGPRAKEAAAKIYEFTQFIYRVLGVVDCGAELDAKVTVRRSCHMTRLLGERTAPFVLLDHVKDIQRVPLKNVQLCCGFGGTFSAKHPELSDEMVKEKAQDAQFVKRTAARREMGHWNEWRDLAEQIRQHVIKYLPDYLEEFSNNVERQGGHVFFVQTEEEARNFIKELAIEKQAKKIVKSKSMVTTEIDLDKTLLTIPGTSLLESDLAEFILQEDNWDEPTHIVFPTLHKNRDQIQREFQKLGYDGDNNPQHEARFVRGYLRKYFMQADFGITGCNFAIASNGMINLDTNEGNADLTMAIPKTQVVVMGMERLVPTMKEAEVLDNMLARSAVGQKLTTYCTFTGKQVAGEVDGPEDFWVIVLDNGRSDALGTEFEPILQCIRCGAYMNVCPVYRHIGGQGYGSIYPGPLGEVLSPILGGYEKFEELPYACSLCGACTETCPVRIPLHSLSASTGSSKWTTSTWTSR